MFWLSHNFKIICDRALCLGYWAGFFFHLDLWLAQKPKDVETEPDKCEGSKQMGPDISCFIVEHEQGFEAKPIICEPHSVPCNDVLVGDLPLLSLMFGSNKRSPPFLFKIRIFCRRKHWS
jgi:hypothetical protein